MRYRDACSTAIARQRRSAWRWLALVGMLGFGWIVLVLPGAVGYSRVGEVQDIRRIPEIGPLLPAFDHEGPIVYRAFHHPHGITSFVLLGKAPRSGIEALCRDLGLCMTPHGGNAANPAMEDFRQRLTPEQIERFGSAAFDDRDCLMEGSGREITDVVGAYRERDRVFFLGFVAVRRELPD